MSRRRGDGPGGIAEGDGRPEADVTLDSWKEIADHLGVSVRTAIRWEETVGMPVHRAPSGHVYARVAELDRWRRTQSGASWRRWLPVGALTIGALVIIAIVILYGRSLFVGAPATVRVDATGVAALDAGGRVRWTASIPHLGRSRGNWGWEVSSPDRDLVADIDQDGQVEVLAELLETDGPTERPGRLACYSQDGRLRWEFVHGRSFKDAYGEYALNYVGHILRLVRLRGRPYVLSIATHRRWHPTQAALLDPSSGRIVEEFWHPGAITHALLADLDSDGADELVLAGVNNPGPGPGSPVLMVLRLPFSLVPVTAGSLLGGMSAGGPVSYVALPLPDVLAAEGGVAAVHTLVFEAPATLFVQARYARNGETNLSYRLDTRLGLRGFFTPNDLSATHDVLWRSGGLDHSFSQREQEWLQGLRSFAGVPDGNAERVPAFIPGNPGK